MVALALWETLSPFGILTVHLGAVYMARWCSGLARGYLPRAHSPSGGFQTLRSTYICNVSNWCISKGCACSKMFVNWQLFCLHHHYFSVAPLMTSISLSLIPPKLLEASTIPRLFHINQRLSAHDIFNYSNRACCWALEVYETFGRL